MRVRRLLINLVALAAPVVATGVLAPPPAAAIANGAAATDDQFPFAVQLRFTGITRSDGTTYDSACSGALISATWIVTAGHCFHDGDRHRVEGVPRYTATARLGTANTTDPAAGITRTVTWVRQSSVNDIAVAHLDAPVDTAAVPPLALSTRKPTRGQVLTVAGWGATSSTGSWSDHLFWGRVTVAAVKTYTVGVVGRWPASTTSACSYDSGAPYVPTGGPAPLLVSVESSGPTCPHSQQETTARVDPVVRWIRDGTDLP
jgi:secreted trypsin-like serine protease